MRRTRYDLIFQVLQRCRRGALLTHVMYEAKLSFEQTKRFLRLLTSRGLIRCEDFQGRISGVTNHVLYVTTEKGERYIRLYMKLQEVLEGENHVQRWKVQLSKSV